MAAQRIHAVNQMCDVWSVDDESAFEAHVTNYNLHRPTGSA